MNNSDQNKILKKISSLELNRTPFDYCVIDDFFPSDLAKKLADEFLDYNDESWFSYENKLEHKKLLSDWRKFPSNTYQAFCFLNSNLILETLSSLFDSTLYCDSGLHGGGWNMHVRGGKLNPHLDYSMHPHLGLQRKLNLIVYLCEDWKDEYGGHFGLWSSDEETGKAGKLHTEIPIGFNKAVIFDTTQNSWHGLSKEVKCPENMSRKSLAVYYLCKPTGSVDPRKRALFAPTEEQKGDKEVQDLIEKRADVNLSKTVYVKHK